MSLALLCSTASGGAEANQQALAERDLKLVEQAYTTAGVTPSTMDPE